MRSPSNPLVVAELYCLGLSVAEVADVLADERDGNVRAGQIRDTLKNAGLLGGRTRDEQRDAFEDKKGDIGGTTVSNLDNDDERESGGLSVSTSDF
jgi:hypothetical protein